VAPFLPIATHRLVLRPFRGDDAEVLAAYRSDPDVARYQSWAAPYGVDAARNLIAAQSQLDGPTRGQWIQIAIERDGQLVGDVAVELSADGLAATIGYTVAPAHQGRGLATEAVGAIVARLFDELAVQRVQASLDPRNDASARVVERLGFVHEGTTVASVLHDGDWTDDARYALTAEEHRARRPDTTSPPA
jgi:RimJ/RimL family protein N-acetyltransferase